MADGGIAYLAYDDNNLTTIITDQGGNKTVYHRDEKYRTTKIVYADCEEIFEYDDSDNCTAHTDRNKNIRRYEYDIYGNMTSSIDPLGSATSMEYNNHNKPTRITNPDGGFVSLVYDNYGNLTGTIDPLGRQTGLTYNDNGLATALTLPDLSESKMEYDERGNIASITDSANVTTLYEYDNLNRVIKSTNGEGASTLYEYNIKDVISKVTNAFNATRSYDYDALGKVVRITDFDGGIIEYKYNSVDKIEEIKDQAGGIIKVSYDLMWNIISIANPNGDVSKYEYDHHNRVIKSIDAEGNATEYKYDNNGNVITVISPLNAETHIKYDVLNRNQEVTEPDGTITILAYDKAGNITQITDALGNITKREYDLAGQLTKLTDPLGNATTFTYTSLGKIEKITNAKGESKTHTYYPGGRLKSVCLPCGETETYEYNKNGNVVKVTDALGNVSALEYDCLGRVIQTTSPLGYNKRFVYDAIGNITQMTDENGNVTQYKYSLLGDIIEVIDAAGHSTKYEYDNTRRLTKLTQYRLIDDTIAKIKDIDGNNAFAQDSSITNSTKDSNSQENADGNDQNKHSYHLEHQITTYQRNKKGEVISVASPLGDIINYAYDPTGKLISKTDEDGLTTLYEYNLVGKLSKIGYADGKTVELSYNPLKHLTQMKDWLGITTIETDSLGRTTKTTDHDGNEIGYAYNSIGQREKITYPDGSEVGYEYNASGRLAKVAHLAQATLIPEITTYIHDPLGRLSERILPNNTKTKYEFNAMGALSSLAHSGSEGTLDQFKYAYDPVGNITQIDKIRTGVESDSGIFKYTYDQLYRLTSVTHGNDVKLYEYDNLGNRVASITDGVKTQHVFNARNQLIRTFENGSCDSLIGNIADSFTNNVTEYNYDRRGNLINITQNGQLKQSFTFDAAGMMSAAFTSDKGSAQYAYNGFKKRVGKLENLQMGANGASHGDIVPSIPDPSQEIRYVLDITRPYNDLLMTRGINNSTFVWGKGLISGCTNDIIIGGEQDSSNAPDTFHYLQDHLGSPIRLIGSDVFSTPLAYDEFGVSKSINTNTAHGFNNPFGYTGYQADDITDLYYAQARYYEPEAGRFFAEDPIHAGLNWYGYCGNNPLVFVDPDGMCAVRTWDAIQLAGAGHGLSGIMPTGESHEGMVLLRFIAEKNGATVDWARNERTRIVTSTITYNGLTFTITNGVSGFISRDRLVVHYSVFEALGWTNETHSLTHNSGDLFPSTTDAAHAWSLVHHPKSTPKGEHVNGSEWIAVIHQYPDEHGRFRYTKFQFGNSVQSDPIYYSQVSPPDVFEYWLGTGVALVHTHPNSSYGGSGFEQFSGMWRDREQNIWTGDGAVPVIDGFYENIYVATPSGALRRLHEDWRPHWLPENQQILSLTGNESFVPTSPYATPNDRAGIYTETRNIFGYGRP